MPRVAGKLVGPYARKPSTVSLPILFDLRVSASAAVEIERQARYRKLTGNELLQRIVERVFEDDLVKAVLDE